MILAVKLDKTKITKNKQLTLSSNRSIIIITIGFALLNASRASPLASKIQVCKTEGCMEAAQQILKNMDKTINPCDDFYKFACGTFIKEAVIPEDQTSISRFTKIINKIQDELKQSLEQKLEKDDPKTFKLLQSYYNICLDTEKLETSSIQELKKILINLGNWPVVAGKSWNDQSNFDWKKLIYKLRKIGFTNSIKSIVKFDIDIDEKRTNKNILFLDQAATGINQNYLSKGLKEKVVQSYYKYMIELAKIFGADEKQAEKELAESLNFEIKLAKISLSAEDRRNMSVMYNLRTLKQLQSDYSYIPWSEYLNELASPQFHIELTDEVIVKDLGFLESLSQLISNTPKRVLANYLFWRVVEESADYMNDHVRKVKAKFEVSLTGKNKQQSRDVECITYVLNNIPVASGAMYVRKHFDEKSITGVKRIVNDVRDSFAIMLKKVDWMDEETKTAAEKKLNSVQTYVGFPDEFLDNEKLDKHFESLNTDADSYLKSHLNLNLFNLAYKLEQLKNPVNKSNWIFHSHSATINAFYGPVENSVEISAGILQGEFFTSTKPAYMNYGSIGWIIGHEFTHGFDDQGSQYDKDGNLANWWNVETQKEYSKRAQCIIDQYSNYTIEEVGLITNGKITQGENIADNGGIKEAYLAYTNFERQNGEEPRLPGLPYSPRQMFWLSAANMWCYKLRPELVKNLLFTSVHSPGQFRITGSFSNIPEFSEDFHCPVGSAMNPVNKCIMW
ncbi:neprilysin-2-like [Phymastichus coffea]|uniref:neprilysin-2-like n=1 Tax=Phymastichus coffea TaxID=108790 RepID=UPI00273CC1A1|nr:neprilysin-2-like [Phymastichus coffea]